MGLEAQRTCDKYRAAASRQKRELLRQRVPSAQRALRPAEEPQGLVSLSKCLRPAGWAFRTAHRSEAASSRAGWAAAARDCGERAEGPRGHCGETAGRRRRDGYPKCLVPLCLPPAQPPGLKVWIGGLGAGGAGI